MHVPDRLDGHAAPVGIDSGESGRQRLDLQAVDAGHRVSFVHEVMGEGEARGPHAGDKHLVSRRGKGKGAPEIERIPAREQRVDLEAPGQLQHVLQGARLDLRYVHRLLLLVDAGFHAIVADTVPGRGHHGIVDDDHGERRERVALRLERVELGDLLFERATGERHAERALLEHHLVRCSLGRFLSQTLGAGILALRVAPDAVVRLVERTDEVGARIGEGEALAPANVLGADRVGDDALAVALLRVHEEVVRIDL